jgi:hypothetical protein
MQVFDIDDAVEAHDAAISPDIGAGWPIRRVMSKPEEKIVIPGQRAALDPEPMNTGFACKPPASVRIGRGLCSWVPGSPLRSAPE